MKVAVLGTGFGSYHVKLYAKMKEVDRIIVWGRNMEKLQSLQKEFSVETTTDMNIIWNDPDIDLVDVCLPNHLHKSTAIKALGAGKNVFIETPVAETLEDAQAIYQAALQNQKRVFVDLFLRFDYAYQYIYQLVTKKKYGKLKEIRVKRETPPWWGNLDGNHIGMNLMIHDVDFVSHLMGEPDTIKAAMVNVKERQSVMSVCMRYEDAYAVVNASSCMPNTYPFSVGYEAIFERATVCYNDNGYSNGTSDVKLELFTDESKEELPIKQVDCYETVIQHVIASLIQSKESCLDIKEAIITLGSVLKINSEIKMSLNYS